MMTAFEELLRITQKPILCYVEAFKSDYFCYMFLVEKKILKNNYKKYSQIKNLI